MNNNNEYIKESVDNNVISVINNCREKYYATSYVNYNKHNKEKRYIFEHILSNRTEYYINEKFIGYDPDDDYNLLTKNLNYNIFIAEKNKNLHNFYTVVMSFI